jgi:hypothetical protein
MCGWPCGQDPGPSRNDTDGAVSCATRREAWVTGFDCGVSVGPISTHPTHQSGGRGLARLNARGSSPLPFARTQERDGRPERMPHSENQWSAHPRVDVLTEVSARDPEVVLIERLPSEMRADEHSADQPAERMGFACEDTEPQEQAILANDGGWAAAPPARSVRRATARRASNRRAIARSLQGDIEASTIAFLLQHPGSTAGDLARGLNLTPEQVSTYLTKLARAGEVRKASHGYSATQPARPRKH